MSKEKEITAGARNYIRITNPGIADKLNELYQSEEFNCNFNRLINDLIEKGLDAYFPEEKSRETLDTEQTLREKKKDEEEQIVEFMEEMVNLMKENIVYLSIVKSIVSSLFNGKVAELDGQPLPKRTFEGGGYRFTPDYLKGYELRAFKEIDGDK